MKKLKTKRELIVETSRSTLARGFAITRRKVKIVRRGERGGDRNVQREFMAEV